MSRLKRVLAAALVPALMLAVMSAPAQGKRPGRRRARLVEAGDAVRRPTPGGRFPREPVRTCVGCRVRTHWSVLLRVVAAEVDGIACVVPDPRRTRGGRGAWLHPDPACLDLAERRRAFPRALRRSGPLDTGALREAVTAGRLHQPSLSESGSEADEHPMSAR